MFSGHKQFYLVFKNESDAYYLDSSLCLNIENYLWFRLHQAGYNAVYFLNQTSVDKLCLIPADLKAAERNTYGKGLLGIGSKKLWENKDSSAYTEKITAGVNATASWLIKRLSEQDVAVITDSRTLNRLYPSDNPERLYDLRQAIQRGTLVVCCPTELSSEDMKFLCGKNSIFGRYAKLFPPLYQIISAENSNIAVFDELKKIVPEQIIEPGYLDFDAVKHLMKQVEFKRDEYYGEALYLDYCNYLYYWLTNTEVRKISGGLFAQITGKMTAKKLVDALCTNQMAAFIERVEKMRSILGKGEDVPLSKLLYQAYGAKEQSLNICHAELCEPALRKLAKIELPIEYEKTDSVFNIAKITKEDWDTMRERIIKPVNHEISDDCIRYIDRFCSRLESARFEHDNNTVLRTINMLYYCGNNLYTVQKKNFNEYCDKACVYLEASEQYHSLLKGLMKLKKMESEENMLVKAKSDEIKLKLMELYERLKDFDIVFSYTTPQIVYDEHLDSLFASMDSVLNEDMQKKSEDEALNEVESIANEMSLSQAIELLTEE